MVTASYDLTDFTGWYVLAQFVNNPNFDTVTGQPGARQDFRVTFDPAPMVGWSQHSNRRDRFDQTVVLRHPWGDALKALPDLLRRHWGTRITEDL
jgi:hypothetical protein